MHVRAVGRWWFSFALVASAAATLPSCAGCQPGPTNGKFVGTVKAEWLPARPERPAREMCLLDDFAYVDPAGRTWPAPKGSVVDGASIPKLLWSVVDSPFTGNFRDASVVHDVACYEQNRRGVKWQDVHRMFFDACLCGGCGLGEAKKLYAAVFYFGPAWDLDGVPIPFWKRARIPAPPAGAHAFAAPTGGSGPPRAPDSTSLEAEDARRFAELARSIDEQGLTIEQIEAFQFSK